MIFIHVIFWALTVLVSFLCLKIIQIIQKQEEQSKRETFLTKQISNTDLDNKEKQEEFQKELNKYKKRVFELEQSYITIVKKIKDEE